jgi:hypothetical protein
MIADCDQHAAGGNSDCHESVIILTEGASLCRDVFNDAPCLIGLKINFGG